MVGHPALAVNTWSLCSMLVKEPSGNISVKTENCNASFPAGYTLVCGSTLARTGNI
jgi:hypothetical protein